MKIDKVIFSTSELFSVFWNLNAKIWATKMGVEPVCLLFGKKANTTMREDYGEIIEMPTLPNIPLLIQITWSKFWWPTQGLEATWMIGDIDHIPMQSAWFVDNIDNVADDTYVHLDANGIADFSGTSFPWAHVNKSTAPLRQAPKELNSGNLPDHGHPTNLPGHYHVAKGRVLKTGLNQDGSYETEVKRAHMSGFGGTRAFRRSDPIDQQNLWCVEECWSTHLIRKNVCNGRIKFAGFAPCLDDRTGRDMNDDNDAHNYDDSKLRSSSYVDVHCIRPFAHFLTPDRIEKRWNNIEFLLQTSWKDTTLCR